MMLKPLRLVSGIAIFLGLAASSFALQNQPTTDQGAPTLTMESMIHDFGTVTSGTPLTYTFKVKNEGTADLLIKNVAPS